LSNPKKAEAEGASICEKKRKSDGVSVYYRTGDQKNKDKASRSASANARKELGLSARGRLSKLNKEKVANFLKDLKSVKEALPGRPISEKSKENVKDKNKEYLRSKIEETEKSLIEYKKNLDEVEKYYESGGSEITLEKLENFEDSFFEMQNSLHIMKRAYRRVGEKESKENSATEGKKEQGTEKKEMSIDDAEKKVKKLYDEMRILQKYPSIKIHQLRRAANLSPEIFDRVIENLARRKKIDLVPADETDFSPDERKESYRDPAEDRIYYYVQWR
jgi:hypothetical protein